MDIELNEINVTLSKNQKEIIRDAFINCEEIKLRFTKKNIRGCDTLLVPTRYFKQMDNEVGLGAAVDEQTMKEMKDTMREELIDLRDNDSLNEMVKDKNIEEIRKRYNRFSRKMFGEPEDEMEKMIKYMGLSDENLEDLINEGVWIYYGLFFTPTIDSNTKKRGLTFFLNYSFLNDLAKDFVKDNIKKLLQ